MQVIFESCDPEAAQLRTLVLRRVRFAMRRLTWLVPRARVQLSDVNGARGGIDKRCQVELMTDAMGSVVITSIGRDWRTALQSALTRAASALLRSRQWDRNHRRASQRVVGFEP